MKTILRALAALFLTSSALPGAVSSLGLPSVDRDAAVSYNQWLASSFIAAPAASAVLVNSITVKLDCVAPNSHVFLAITGTAGGRPNMDDIRVVGDTAALVSTVGLHSVVMFTIAPLEEAGPAVLLPDQHYWLVFGVTEPDYDEDLPGGLFHWSYAAASGATQTHEGWSVGPATATGNTAGQNWTPENSTPYSFSLSLTTIPEPGPATLFFAAMVLSAGFRSRRR